jgi:hypothetical protein
MVGGEGPTPLAREGYRLTELDYELRDDGLLYTLDDGTRVKVQGNSPRSVTVSLQRGQAIVPPRPVTWEDPSCATGWRASLGSVSARRMDSLRTSNS